MRTRTAAAALFAVCVPLMPPLLAQSVAQAVAQPAAAPQTPDSASTPLTIVAELKARPGKEKQLRDALQALIAPTRQQQGNINYDMLVSNEDPGVVIFYENWRTKAEWQAHMHSSILVDFAKKQPQLAQSWKLYQMTRLP